MALSEQEQRLLEQLEASLKAEDPKFADALSGTTQIKVHRRRAAIAGLVFIVGVVVLIVGVQVHPAVSIAGFLLMLGGALVGISSWRRVADDNAQPSRPGSGPRTSPGAGSSQDFMDKLEERWRRRQNGDL
ncbi:spore wall synthesis complex protein [Tessaracoccus lubricantis]|uniref:Spore wall synthesis complex protein n=1 Tax=Tessaracoccus lubricantis TaxID=545543 RepID=A0ABP9FHY1_9ACTN